MKINEITDRQLLRKTTKSSNSATSCTYVTKESATAGSTSSGDVAVGAVYPNKKAKTLKNKDGTVKNALDIKGISLFTGGSIRR